VPLFCEASRAIFAACYNFAWKREAQRQRRPVIASEIADKVWSVKELIERATGCDALADILSPTRWPIVATKVQRVRAAIGDWPVAKHRLVAHA
jgi:hypothetical protein